MTPQREANDTAHDGYSQRRRGIPIVRLSAARHNMIQRGVADLCSLYLRVSHAGCCLKLFRVGVASCPNQASASRGGQVEALRNSAVKIFRACGVEVSSAHSPNMPTRSRRLTRFGSSPKNNTASARFTIGSPAAPKRRCRSASGSWVRSFQIEKRTGEARNVHTH